jgi:hypothetical protein
MGPKYSSQQDTQRFSGVANHPTLFPPFVPRLNAELSPRALSALFISFPAFASDFLIHKYSAYDSTNR